MMNMDFCVVVFVYVIALVGHSTDANKIVISSRETSDDSTPGPDATLCPYVMSLDCKTQVTEHYEVCGTDGVTYHNNCHFLQTSCVDTTLGLAHQGTCHLSTTPVGTNSSLTSIPTTGSTTMEGTTPSVSSLPSIAQIIHSVFCETKDSITCDHSLNLQCGSNGQVYPNECEFYKAACDDSALILTDSSKCAI